MDQFDLTSGDPTQVGPVQITYGVRGAELERPSGLLTYIYVPRGGNLAVTSNDITIPPRSIVRINAGVMSRFTPREETLESVVFRIEGKVPTLTAQQEDAMARHGVTPVLVDRAEWHDAIKTYLGGAVIVLPKFKPDTTPVKGWPCNYRKGQVLQIDGGAEWSAVRAAEQAHYHIVLNEMYIGLNGSAKIRYNDDVVALTAGHALWSAPGNTHCVLDVTAGPSGFYSHVVAQYPPVQNDKIVVD